jgi:hypothetical protein
VTSQQSELLLKAIGAAGYQRHDPPTERRGRIEEVPRMLKGES